MSQDNQDLLIHGAVDFGKFDVPTGNGTCPSTGRTMTEAVIKRFAERAFSSSLTDADLDSYYQVSLDQLRGHGDFTRAAKTGLKAVISSHRFLLVPGSHENPSYARAAALASRPEGRLSGVPSR